MVSERWEVAIRHRRSQSYKRIWGWSAAYPEAELVARRLAERYKGNLVAWPCQESTQYLPATVKGKWLPIRGVTMIDGPMSSVWVDVLCLVRNELAARRAESDQLLDVYRQAEAQALKERLQAGPAPEPRSRPMVPLGRDAELTRLIRTESLRAGIRTW